ncbi:AI-2E family transporter [Peptoniphilus mikwangii]|uniref:AI-2E family transporter n=1 Tax=Peptoniphilus mikwangii TaxID=1354300 RepID=UPI0003F53900|nr:AI-2E family transporter [Peptoniphilus mikwangii]
MSSIKAVTPGFITTAVATLSIFLLFLIIYYLINIGNRYIDRNKRINIDLKLAIRILFGVVVLYSLKLIFNKYPIVSDTIWALIAAIIVSFLINPVVTYFETKKINRKYGVIIVYVSVILVLAILLIIVIPKTIQEITNLLKSIPSLIDQSGKILNDLSEKLNKSFNYDLPKNEQGRTIIEEIQNSINKYIVLVPEAILSKLKNLTMGMQTVFSKLLRFVLIFIFSFYFTVDKNKFKNILDSHIPVKHRNDILYIASRINSALHDFVKGRLLMAVFVGFATMVYLLILGVDFAVVIGIITCIADIIPYIGPFLGFVPAVLFAFIESPIKALWVAILFLLLQWAENNIIAPKLLADKTGLNPMVILIAIIIGGGVFGIWGMIFAVPIVSVALILIDFAKMKYNERNRNIV